MQTAWKQDQQNRILIAKFDDAALLVSKNIQTEKLL